MRSAAEQAREPRLAKLAVLVWLLYTATGFHPFWQPLVETEGNLGGAIRQLVFLSCAGYFCWELCVRNRWRSVLTGRLHWLAVSGYLLATLAYSDDPVLTAKRSIVVACGMLVVLGVVELCERPERLLLSSVVLVSGAAAVVSLGMWAALPSEYWQLSFRPGLAGVAGHPNTLGPILMLGWLASLGVSWLRPGLQRLTLRALQASLLLALLLTDAVTSILAATVGSAVFAWLNSSSYVRSTMLVVAAPVALLVWIDLDAITADLLSGVGRDASLTGRPQLWRAAFLEVEARPFLGAGYGAFWYEGRGREIVGTWNPRQSHHAYLDLLLDLGIVGAAVVFWVLGRAISAGVTRWRQSRAEAKRSLSAMLAICVGLLGVLAFAESFMPKTDKYQFFVLLWMAVVFETGAGRTSQLASQIASARPPSG